MKYLKKFESLFNSKPILFYDNSIPRGVEMFSGGPKNEPKKFDFYMQRKEVWDEFEKDLLISFAEQNREKINSYSFDTSVTSDMDIFTIVLNDQDTSDEIDTLKEIYCHKCDDDVYIVQEFLLDPNIDKRYYCGGFDVLLELLEDLI